MTFLQPRDPRWQGPQRWYLTVDLLKNTTLLLFTILVIVETSLHRKWYNTYYQTVEYDSSDSITSFFFRIGLALLPDVLSTLLTHTLLVPTLSFHPAYALTQSLVLACLYPIVLAFNAIIVLSDETWIYHFATWQGMCYAEMALQGVLWGCWVGLVVCSCVAVHQGRRARAEERVKAVIRGEIELKGLERRDIVGVEGDAEGAGLVGGSAKSERVFV